MFLYGVTRLFYKLSLWQFFFFFFFFFFLFFLVNMPSSSKKTTIRRTERKTPKHDLVSFCAQWTQKRGTGHKNDAQSPCKNLEGRPICSPKISIPAAETKLGCVLSYLENATIVFYSRLSQRVNNNTQQLKHGTLSS